MFPTISVNVKYSKICFIVLRTTKRVEEMKSIEHNI